MNVLTALLILFLIIIIVVYYNTINCYTPIIFYSESCGACQRKILNPISLEYIRKNKIPCLDVKDYNNFSPKMKAIYDKYNNGYVPLVVFINKKDVCVVLNPDIVDGVYNDHTFVTVLLNKFSNKI